MDINPRLKGFPYYQFFYRKMFYTLSHNRYKAQCGNKPGIKSQKASHIANTNTVFVFAINSNPFIYVS